MSISRVRPSIVYHYCSLETFFQIILNSSIRLSNISKSNDAEEIKYILPHVIEFCNDLFGKYNNRLNSEFMLENGFMERLFEYTFNELSLNFYVACFSEESDLLSQWRGYANDACGVSIGFNTNCFYPLAKSIKSSYNFSQVKYSLSDFNSQINEYVINELENKWTVDDKNNSILLMNMASYISYIILYNAIFYKNPNFREELEWRLSYNPFGNIRGVKDRPSYYDSMNNSFIESRNKGFIRKPMSFRINKDKIISHIDLDFSEIKSCFIKEIIIGSKANINDTDLDLFLCKYGYDPMHMKIIKSKIPYR